MVTYQIPEPSVGRSACCRTHGFDVYQRLALVPTAQIVIVPHPAVRPVERISIRSLESGGKIRHPPAGRSTRRLDFQPSAPRGGTELRALRVSAHDGLHPIPVGPYRVFAGERPVAWSINRTLSKSMAASWICVLHQAGRRHARRLGGHERILIIPPDPWIEAMERGLGLRREWRLLRFRGDGGEGCGAKERRPGAFRAHLPEREGIDDCVWRSRSPPRSQ